MNFLFLTEPIPTGNLGYVKDYVIIIVIIIITALVYRTRKEGGFIRHSISVNPQSTSHNYNKTILI